MNDAVENVSFIGDGVGLLVNDKIQSFFIHNCSCVIHTIVLNSIHDQCGDIPTKNTVFHCVHNTDDESSF